MKIKFQENTWVVWIVMLNFLLCTGPTFINPYCYFQPKKLGPEKEGYKAKDRV